MTDPCRGQILDADEITRLRSAVRDLREELAEAYKKLSGTATHTSDCATSMAPAMDPGPCDCRTIREAFPDLPEIMSHGLGLSDALAFWSWTQNTPALAPRDARFALSSMSTTQIEEAE